jgi:hypothetical protein
MKMKKYLLTRRDNGDSRPYVMDVPPVWVDATVVDAKSGDDNGDDLALAAYVAQGLADVCPWAADSVDYYVYDVVLADGGDA